MKAAQYSSDKFTWESVRSSPRAAIVVSPPQSKGLSKLMVWLILFVATTYLVYTLKLLSSSHSSCEDEAFPVRRENALILEPRNGSMFLASNVSAARFLYGGIGAEQSSEQKGTGLEHVVFGIAASARLWEKRKEYIKLWWKPDKRMRGIVWLDSSVKTSRNECRSLPPLKISGDTSHFSYKNKQGHRSAVRISRIVSETLRLGKTNNVRWFVMGDDDTVFITENLIRILNKYDHNQYYYIGSSSESHLQNIYFSYTMAYGGGGFAISYPLAKALEKMQDKCIQRYPGLYGSDDRMQACMAELGVPLTKELGFHQYDVYGNLFGLLAAHPVTPLISLHHLDVVEPIFPNLTRIQALKLLQIPANLDSAGLMQQSICYDKANKWTISVSWGFAVQIFRGILSPREIEIPSRTFLNWYRKADYTAYAFNTRPVMRNPCEKPFVFYLSNARKNDRSNLTVSEYTRHHVPYPLCKWKMANPGEVDKVEVYKKQDPHLWERSPRRNCCRVMESKKKSLVVDVGICDDGEIIEQ